MKYFHFIEFLRNKKIPYLIVINILNASIISLFIFLLLIGLNLKKKNFIFKNKILVKILKAVIPLFSFSLFGQIFNALLSTNRCKNNFVFYDLNQKCGNQFLFMFEYILSIISIVFLCLLAMFTVSIYYIPILIKGNNIIKKLSSITEQIFFVTKIIIILLFYIEDKLKEKNKNINSYLMLVILVIFSGVNSYFSLVYKNYENQKLLLINNIMSTLLFWGFCSLLVGYVFQYISYNGTDYLIIIGSLLIIFYQIYYNEIYKDEYLKNINYIYTNQERLNYIIKCIDIIEKRKKSRKNKIILKTLLERVELYCINPHCPIKQYFHQLKKGIDSNILLYAYIQTLFKKYTSKYKNDITTKIYYIIFVMSKLNERKNAQILLKKLEDRQLILLQDLFNIYRVNKYMEEISYSDFDEDKIYKTNLLNLVQYKKYVKDFKNMLFKISSLYLNFWTLLLNSHNHFEHIDHLNNTGKEIKDLIENINDYFIKIHNYRNDRKIVKLYINFLKNVLVDKKSYEKYNQRISNINLENKNFNNEDDYTNYNVNKLKESDETQWILISAGDKTGKNCGKILNVSLGICPIIGYKKREIIGNNIEVLIPNIFHKPHAFMMHKLFYDTKYKFFESLSKRIEYKPDCITKKVYCKNKSKFLVPFPFRAFFVQNEEGEHMFIMNVLKQQCFPNTKISNNEDPWCCVLTDKNFIIQTFTPNAYDMLGLNSTDIDSGLNITTCITQFGAHFFSSMNSKENTLENDIFNYSSDFYNETITKSFLNARTFKSEGKPKNNVAKLEYSQPRLISWKYNHNKDKKEKKNGGAKVFSRLSSERCEIKININSSSNSNKENTLQDKKLMLQIKESKIYNKLIGYKFMFKKIKVEHKEILATRSNYINNNHLNIKVIEQSEFMESEISEISNFVDKNVNNYSPTSTLRTPRKPSIKKNESPLTLFNTMDKPLKRRRHSQGNFPQKMNINNFFIPFTVDETFVPRNKCNFYFVLDTMSYVYHDKFRFKHTITNQNTKELKEDLLLKALEKEAIEKLNHLKSLHHEMSKRSVHHELISNSNSSNSSSSLSCSNSFSEESSSSEENMGSLNQEALHKHYNSFMVQKLHKSQGNLPNMSKYQNKTTKSNFGKKSIKDQPLFEKISNKLKEKNKLNFEFKYYEVNLKNIRFLKYDFYKEMIVEDVHNDKISKMKEIINKIKNNDNIINKDENYPSINFTNLTPVKIKSVRKSENKTSLKKKKGDKKLIQLNKIIVDNSRLQADKKVEQERKINEALNKKDKQHSIRKFLSISIICLLLFYTIGSVNLYLYLDEVDKDKENIRLICESSELKYYFISEVYFIRELTLLSIKNITKISNGEYTGYASNNKTQNILVLINKTLELYSYIHSLNEIIIATELPLSKNTTYYLNEKEYIIEALSTNFEIINLRTSLSSAIITLDAYLYNLVELTSTIEQSHEDVFPFIHNTLNNVGILLNIQIELYMNELDFRRDKNKIKFIVSYCIVFVILVIIFILISKGYTIVLKNKSNFFHIFYGIKLEAIRSLISNCEYFLQKLKEDNKILNEEKEDEKNDEKEDDTTDILNPRMNIKLNSVITHNNKGSHNYNYNILSPNKKKVLLNKIISDQYKKGKEENINYRNNLKIFNICFIIFCLLNLVYLLIVFGDYISFLNLISEYSTYMNHLQTSHNGIIEIINAYREFLFDENSLVQGINSNDYIDNKMDEMFMEKFTDNIIFSKYRGKIPNYLDKYNDFHSKSLCSRRNEYYFKTEEECNNHMQGISTYGLSVLYTSITEEIRIFKNMINQLLMMNGIVGNLTLYGSEYWKDDDIVYEMNNRNVSILYFRLYLFNNNSYHKDLNILFINTLYPYINTEFEMTDEAINGAISNKGSTYIIFFTCYIIAITLLFILYWIPMINNMNITFYKTKKMLSIIPLHILTSQSNISSLLNIDENNYQIDDSK